MNAPTAAPGPDQTVDLPIQGMDCPECALHVQHAIAGVPGVRHVQVLLGSEKALIELAPEGADMAAICRAVAAAGYRAVPPGAPDLESQQRRLTRRIFSALGLVFGAVLLVVVVGEWLGVLGQITELVPFWAGAALVIISGWPVFRHVLQAARQRRVISHTLMSLGVLAALAVGQWATAAVVVFFMRVGDYVERMTASKARHALHELADAVPRRALVERDGVDLDVAIDEVTPGDIVVVRPGDSIPVDGQVISGCATLNQTMITGEAMPVEVGPGAKVFAATTAQLGALRIVTERVGSETTFGRIVALVEDAEANRGAVERVADRFSAYFLPVVVGIALATLLISRNALAAASVLVVACSCSFALATPVAVLATMGAAAKMGLLIKGGRTVEALATADVVLIDKTGTLTLGRPRITDVIALDGMDSRSVLTLAGAAERYSEHPLARAVRAAAHAQGVPPLAPSTFTAVPGIGVQADVEGRLVVIGSGSTAQTADGRQAAAMLAAQGKSVITVSSDGALIGILGAADTLRPEVPAALAELRRLGVRHLELLTGDHEQAAAALAAELGIGYRADMLPQDKIAAVRALQAAGRRVVMIGDGVNDAPALAQADVGIAMGAAGSDLALEAADVALMRDDWMLAPAALHLAQRSLRVIKMNLWLTVAYNVVGLSLAACGLLPPVLAAALQTFPDLFILGNSARLLQGQARAAIPGAAVTPRVR